MKIKNFAQSTQNFMNKLNENRNFVGFLSFLILIMRSFEIKQNLIL